MMQTSSLSGSVRGGASISARSSGNKTSSAPASLAVNNYEVCSTNRKDRSFLEALAMGQRGYGGVVDTNDYNKLAIPVNTYLNKFPSHTHKQLMGALQKQSQQFKSRGETLNRMSNIERDSTPMFVAQATGLPVQVFELNNTGDRYDPVLSLSGYNPLLPKRPGHSSASLTQSPINLLRTKVDGKDQYAFLLEKPMDTDSLLDDASTVFSKASSIFSKSGTEIALSHDRLTEAYSGYIREHLVGGQGNNDFQTMLTDATPTQIRDFLKKLSDDFNKYQSAMSGLQKKGITKEEKSDFRKHKRDIENSIGNNIRTDKLGFTHRKGRQEVIKALNVMNGSIGKELEQRIERIQTDPSLLSAQAQELNELILAWNDYVGLAATMEKPGFKIKEKQFKSDIAVLPKTSELKHLSPVEVIADLSTEVGGNSGFFSKLNTALFDFFGGLLYPFSDEEEEPSRLEI